MQSDRGPINSPTRYSAPVSHPEAPVSHPEAPVSHPELMSSVPRERGDAARNRTLLLDAARRLVAERGADAVSMDDVAAAAGVGKGTLFRRFGSRANLMMVLLDEDERASQHAFLFGPPPLGPGAPPLERLLAFGRERLRFVNAHATLLSAAGRDPQVRYGPVYALLHTHVRTLLAAAGSGNGEAGEALDAKADALLGLLDPDYVTGQLAGGRTLEALGDGWDAVARAMLSPAAVPGCRGDAAPG